MIGARLLPQWQLERYEARKNAKSVLRLNDGDSPRGEAQHFLLYLNNETHDASRKQVQQLWDDITDALKEGMHFVLVHEFRPDKVRCMPLMPTFWR